jgi:antirestriction protein ArdC
LKRFTVFNIAQCEGLRDGLFADAEPLPEREIVPVAEEVIAASGIPFRIGGAKASMPHRRITCRCPRNRPFSSR